MGGAGEKRGVLAKWDGGEVLAASATRQSCAQATQSADQGTSSGGNWDATCPGSVVRLDTLMADAVVEDG